MGQQNIIELNGKRYDAITGVILGDAKSPVVAIPTTRSIDGVVRPRNVRPVAQSAVSHPHKTAAASAQTLKPATKKMDITRVNSQHVRHHKQQKGQTLMRRAVHKPEASLKPKIKTAVPSEIAPASAKTIAKPLAKKLSASNVDPQREQRAHTVARSGRVRRFTGYVKQRAQPAFDLAAIARPAATSYAQPQQATVQEATTSPQPDIFEAALARATSHQQPAPAVRRRTNKTVSVIAGIAAFLIMGGFLTYLNMPGIQMQFASMSAGFSAELPTYKPTGYAMQGGVEQQDGRVSVSFRSGDSSYTVSQQTSDWNSQTLLENYVAVNSSSHQTVQSQGRTIYLFNGTDAAWVDGGVRYQITGNAPLSADDIVKVATSI